MDWRAAPTFRGADPVSQNGKGDKQRPAQITPEQMAERWARTFGGTELKPEGKGAG